MKIIDLEMDNLKFLENLIGNHVLLYINNYSKHLLVFKKS